MENKSEPQRPQYKAIIEREFSFVNSEKKEDLEQDQTQSSIPSLSLSDIQDLVISFIEQHNENQSLSEEKEDDDDDGDDDK